MANETTQSNKRDSRDASREEALDGRQQQEQDQAQAQENQQGEREEEEQGQTQRRELDQRRNGRDGNRQLALARSRPEPGEVFDPRAAMRLGLLRLARNWKDQGSTYQAIHAYTEVVVRYPQSGAADAAVEELLGMADKLAQQGRYYAALNIFNRLEQLC